MGKARRCRGSKATSESEQAALVWVAFESGGVIFNISPGKAATSLRVMLYIIHHHSPHPPRGYTHTLTPQRAPEPRTFVTH